MDLTPQQQLIYERIKSIYFSSSSITKKDFCVSLGVVLNEFKKHVKH